MSKQASKEERELAKERGSGKQALKVTYGLQEFTLTLHKYRSDQSSKEFEELSYCHPGP